MQHPTPKDILDTALVAWNRGDLDGYLRLYGPTVRLHGYSPEPMLADGVRGFYLAFFEAFPGARLIVEDTVVEGDRLMCRFRLDMTHRGPFMGVPATGRSVVLQGHTSMRFEGGVVVERWSTADFLGLMIQLGAIAPPG